MRASNDLPTAKEPTWCSRQQTWAPPSVARKSNVAIGKCLLANESGFDGVGLEVKLITLDAILVCWITVSIEGENPPETSVPRPTCGEWG